MATKEYEKALPHLDADTKPFWEYCKRHELRLQKCKDCGAYIWHPRRFCGDCLSDNTEWVKASGKGTVYTYTIVRPAYARGWHEEIPYVVAYIELEEGIR